MNSYFRLIIILTFVLIFPKNISFACSIMCLTPTKFNASKYVFIGKVVDVIGPFEDEKKQHGLWLTRIPEAKTEDSDNITPGEDKFINDPENELKTTKKQARKKIEERESEPPDIEVSEEFIQEKDVVPSFVARVGDRVIKGSNNTLIFLGRDRPSDVESGEKEEAGTVCIVTGREDEDINLDSDKSCVYISMKTDVDGNFGIDVGPPSDPTAAIGIKSDEIRVVARNGAKIVVEGGDLHLEGANIFVGNNASEQHVLGTTFRGQQATKNNQLIAALTKVISAMETGKGASAPPGGGPLIPLNSAFTLAAAAFVEILAAVQAFESNAMANQNYLSNTVKTKK